MTIWDWMRDFDEQARASGDAERMRLCRLHSEAYGHRQTDPDRMLLLLEEGRRLAGRLREPWWALFFEHWKVETLIYYKDDYREVIDLAVRATLELRKPGFENFPLRFGIWCNLVAAYLCVDPRGYAAAIRAALDYLGQQVPAEGSDRYLLQARRHWFAYELGDLALAERLALEELAMADSDADRHTARHHAVDTYKALCWIAFRRGDWSALAGHALAGEEIARTIEYRYELALFLLWRGLVARRDRREAEAQRLVRQGTAQMARLGQPPGESYYDALAAYHELGDNPRAAWEVRQRELETTLGKGQLAYECQVRIKRVRVLRRLGEPAEDEAQAARAAAARLRAPAWYLDELGRALAVAG
jgi:hypothetical protein